MAVLCTPTPCVPIAGGSAVVSGSCASEQCGTRDAESYIVDLEGRMAAAPYRGSTAPVLVIPAAATEHPVGAVDLGVVDVPAPLPHVAQHVVQVPRIGSLAAHVVYPPVGVAAVPSDLAELSVSRAVGTGTTCVL